MKAYRLILALFLHITCFLCSGVSQSNDTTQSQSDFYKAQMEALGINFDSMLMMTSYHLYMRFINEPQPRGSWLFLNTASQAYYDSVALKIRTLDRDGIESLTIDDQIKILQVRLSQPRDSLIDFSGFDYFKFSQSVSLSILTKDDHAAANGVPVQSGGQSIIPINPNLPGMMSETVVDGDQGVIYFGRSGVKIPTGKQPPEDEYMGLYFSREMDDWKFDVYRSTLQYLTFEAIPNPQRDQYLKERGWSIDDWLPLMLSATTGRALTGETYLPPAQWQSEMMSPLSEEQRNSTIKEAFGWMKYVQERY